jgi:hypothetical protein
MAQARTSYDMTVYPMTVAVRSASNGARAHLVQLPYCDCEDFTNRRGRLTTEGTVTVCKHVREALERVGGWHREDPKDEVYEDLTYSEASELLTSILAVDATMVLGALAGVHTGQPVELARAAGEAVRLSVKPGERGRRYTVTIPA